MIGMSGFSVLESESRGDKLWLPTGTRAQEDYVSGYAVCCVCCVALCMLCVIYRQRSNSQCKRADISTIIVWQPCMGSRMWGCLRPLVNTL